MNDTNKDYNLPKCYLLKLRLRSTDEDGQVVETETWTAGVSEKLALKIWNRKNPALALKLVGHELVTPGPTKSEPVSHKGNRAVMVGAKTQVAGPSMEGWR